MTWAEGHRAEIDLVARHNAGQPIILDHTMPEYAVRRERSNYRWNGAYYYSKEIVRNIIPNVVTDRNWVTIHQQGRCLPHSIVFIHNNLKVGIYEWMKDFDDLVLVCGIPETCAKLAHLGRTAYLPLSVDVEYVESFKRDKDKDVAYVGRRAKHRNEVKGTELPNGIDYLEDMPRTELLEQLARYERVYAVGRCAIEAKVLGCEVLAYDPRFPDPSVWKVFDNKAAAKLLQMQLDAIDGRM